MLHPLISNMGLKGIRKSAQMIPRWPEQMAADNLKWALFNGYIFISPVGGTGGGIFRYMFSRFLAESAVLTGDERLAASADAFRHIGDQWEASLLAKMQQAYDQMDEIETWETLIAELREEHKRLRALQDGLNKAGL